MDGEERLRNAIRTIENRGGAPSCRGDFILAIQRELHGSVCIGLQPEELAKAITLLDDRPGSMSPANVGH